MKFPLRVGALALVMHTPFAHAQRWAMDRYTPTPAGDVFLAVDHPRYGGDRRTTLAAAVRGGYAYEPLVARTPGAAPRAVITHASALHLGLALRFAGRMEFDLALPISLGESGAVGENGPGPFGPAAVGDLRVGARVRLVGALDGPASLHLGVQLFMGFLGISPVTANVSDGWARGRFTAIAAGRVGIFRWSSTLGAQLRPTTEVNGEVVSGSEFQGAVAAGLEIGPVIVGPEFWFATRVDAPFARGATAGEALLGARVALPGGFSLGLAGGPGLLGAPGVPNGRVLTALSWEPRPARGR